MPNKGRRRKKRIKSKIKTSAYQNNAYPEQVADLGKKGKEFKCCWCNAMHDHYAISCTNKNTATMLSNLPKQIKRKHLNLDTLSNVIDLTNK